MLTFLPLQPQTLLPLLDRVFADLHRPAPVAVRLQRAPDTHGHYVVTDERGAITQLVVTFQDQTGSGSNGPLLAARRLEDDPQLPMAGSVVSLPVQALGAVAYLQPMPQGPSATAWVHGDASRLDAALQRMGWVLAELSRRPQTDRGVLATPHGFYGSRSSWGEDYVATAHRWAELAKQGGTALQPMTDELLCDLKPAALQGMPATLVPADLSFDTLWLSQDGVLSAVGGWTTTWAGDPWSAWAPFLHLPARSLSKLALALGDASLSQHSERLQSYASGQVLRLLAAAAVAPGPSERIHTLRMALQLFERRSSLTERLQAADQNLPEPVEASTSPAPHSALALLDRLVRSPTLTQQRTWVGLAAGVCLAHHLAGAPPALGWSKVVSHSLKYLEPGLDAAPNPAAVSPEVVLREALSATSESGTLDTTALALLWLSRELVGIVGHQPAGLDSAVRALVQRFAPVKAEEMSAVDALEHALIGLAALDQLLPASDADRMALQDRLANQARLAWDVLDFGLPKPTQKPAQYLEYFSSLDHHQGHPRRVALALFSVFRSNNCPLPAHPSAVLRAIGIQIP